MITKESVKGLCRKTIALLKGDSFAYILPHPALRSRISNYTVTFPYPGMMSDRYAVVPHGSATLVYICDKDGISGSQSNDNRQRRDSFSKGAF